MGRPRKIKATKQIRVYEDVAKLVQQFAAIFDKDVADFLDAPLRRFLESRRDDAMRLLAEKMKR